MRVNAIQQLMPHRTENSIRQKASSLMLKARLDTNIENSIIKEMKDSGANTLTIAKRIGCSLRTVYRRINLIYA
jgi:DNA invertase Pin-like site-specific DNA recombinase